MSLLIQERTAAAWSLSSQALLPVAMSPKLLIFKIKALGSSWQYTRKNMIKKKKVVVGLDLKN